MLKMTPDTHNGKAILRPISHHDDGIPRLASSAVFHPPSVSVVHPHEPLGRLVAQEARAIVGMKALTSDEIAQRLWDFAQRIIVNESRRVVR